jgi:hypothetical protein
LAKDDVRCDRERTRPQRHLWFSGQRDEGLFVGLWVPSILAFGTYIRVSTAKK